MIFDLDGRSITIIDEADRVVLHMNEGGYERDTLAAWAGLIEQGRVALDIGAYTGLFSVIAAVKGAHTIAFEPMPANLWRLGVNVRANKVHVIEMQVAVSDQCGRATLHYNPLVPLTTGASLEAGIEHHRDSIEVDCVTIDALSINDIAAIKIDVERHEPAVLRGAMKTIERDRPKMLIETLDAEMRDAVLSMLPRYRIEVVLDGRNTLFIPQ